MESNNNSKTILSSKIFQIFVILSVVAVFVGYNFYTNKELQENIVVNLNLLLNTNQPDGYQNKVNSPETEITNKDICITNYDQIIQLIDSFELAQKNRDPNIVLSLFSPPQTDEERSTYNYLVNNSETSSRLYNDETFDYTLNALLITDNPIPSGVRKCKLKVSENRLLNRKSESLDYEFEIEVIRENNIWLINKYYYKVNESSVSDKYSAFYLYL